MLYSIAIHPRYWIIPSIIDREAPLGITQIILFSISGADLKRTAAVCNHIFPECCKGEEQNGKKGKESFHKIIKGICRRASI